MLLSKAGEAPLPLYVYVGWSMHLRWAHGHVCTASSYNRGCAEIEADEKQATTVTWDKNGNLGRFTNFVNLMDMAAVAVPSGILRCKPAPTCSTGQSLHA